MGCEPFARVRHVGCDRTGANIYYIDDRTPVAAELPGLLGVDVKQKRYCVGMLVSNGLDVRHIDPAP